MNKDQVKGVAKEVVGKIQKEAGELINSPTQVAKGTAKELEGKVQKRVGDVKEAIKDAKG
jgi:uncharacterized protein YjbJ (UPF0337 family)